MAEIDAPVTGVWEITMGCNMRCKHCGSSCTNPLPDELTTDEALALCDDIAALGLQWITLSGGEPLTRPDWPLLVRRLREGGVIPNIITNGWMCDAKTVATARDAGVGTFALSLDGMKETHDYIRRKGSYDRCLGALKTMAEAGVSAGVITTVHRRNIGELPAMHRMLKDIGVESWQLQIGLPMGNFRRPERADLVAEPEDVDRVIDFIYSHGEDDGALSIYPADCLGYYSHKELVARQRAFRTSEPVVWQGCNAGRRSLGILHNGDVLGCTSIRDRSFVEGNLRQRSLRDIWYDPGSFPWARRLTKQDLAGTCRTCAYGDACLGGCPNTRLTMNGTIHSENKYCSYNVALTKAREEVERMGDAADTAMARRLIERGEMPLAALVLERVVERAPDDREALGLLGYANYALDNLDDSLRINERVLELDPGDVYATKGLGVVLHRMGRTDEGISTLRRAVDLSGGRDLDSMHDLAVACIQSGRTAEARDVLEQARRLSPDFARGNPELYGSVA